MRGERGAECTWPPLSAPFDAALREATRFVFEETDPLGVIATGTIIRGKAHASSDLDIYVIHGAPFRRRVQHFFAGVPAEIFINPSHAIRGYFAEEHEDGRPISAHMLATGFTVYASTPLVEELRAEARDWLQRPSPMSETDVIRMRYGIATRLEDGIDVVEVDGATATMLLGDAVESMLEFFCRSRTGRVPRSKDLLAVASTHDAEVGRLAAGFFESGAPRDRARFAEALADRTIGARGFFPWDSGPQPIPLP
jgi:hypothetical protein